ncbi:fimbrial protein [Enterobacter sp.]|uniref:fimbrial protein n=1 Tax=Enterobacter sp. TaxID=42895 RepID=UPI00296FCEC5|nr:fimbrial protein [Enterobacter sp.]
MNRRSLRHLIAWLLTAMAVPAMAASEDVTTVYITGTLVDAPECTVNGNNKIDVDFGDNLITRLVDGVNYRTKIIYVLTCTSLAKQGLTLTINGTSASFDSRLLRTNKDGLGIRLYSGSTAINPGQAINFNYGSSPELYAVPVAQDNTTLTAGDFTGTGTMVFAYQ